MTGVPTTTLRPPGSAPSPGAPGPSAWMPRGSVTYPSNGDAAAIAQFAQQLASVAAGLGTATQLLRSTHSHAGATWVGPAADAFREHLSERWSHIDAAHRATSACVEPVRALAAAVASTSQWYARGADTELRLVRVTDPGAEALRRDAVWQQVAAVRGLLDAGDQAAALLRPNIDQIATAGRALTANTNQAAPSNDARTGVTGNRSIDEVIDYLLGDLLSLWNGGPNDEHLPLGKIAAALMRIGRIGTYVHSGFDPNKFPTWNTGSIAGWTARQLGRFEATAAAGTWLSTPARATPWFRGAGIVGGIASTGIGAYDLVQQGNPIAAYERRGAGYVADVASTAFSASTTAFLIAPNPVTAGAAIVTGVVWAGAEVVDHWDEIVDVADTVGTAVSDTVDGVVTGARTAATDMIDQTFGEWMRRAQRRSGPDGAWF